MDNWLHPSLEAFLDPDIAKIATEAKLIDYSAIDLQLCKNTKLLLALHQAHNTPAK